MVLGVCFDLGGVGDFVGGSGWKVSSCERLREVIVFDGVRMKFGGSPNCSAGWRVGVGVFELNALSHERLRQQRLSSVLIGL